MPAIIIFVVALCTVLFTSFIAHKCFVSAITAESRADAFEHELEGLKHKFEVVQTQLASSMQDKVAFMAGSDIATAGLKLVNDDTAAAVVEAIKPQLGGVSRAEV